MAPHFLLRFVRPPIENRKQNRCSILLSIPLLLLTALPSLHILLAPVLLQQVAPEYYIENAIGFQVSFQYLCFSSILSLPSIYWWLLFCSSRWSQNTKSKMQSFFKFPFNISVSPPSSILSLYTGSSCFAPAGGPRIVNQTCNHFSSFLSISMFLLPPLSSLYILVAPVLPQQVVPE